MGKQLKDREHIEAIIKISKIREVFKEGNLTEFKDKLICIKVDKPTITTTTCFPDTKKGGRDLIKFIKDELYLN